MANEGAVAALPQAQVAGGQVPADVLSRIPKQIAEEFGAVFFAETADELHLGIVHPELLKDRVQEALAVLEKQVGKRIKLFKLDSTTFENILKQYDQSQNKSNTTTATVAAELPNSATEQPTKEVLAPNYEIGAEVAESVLVTMPSEYAQAKRLITVDNIGDEFWVATDKKNDEQTIALDLMARRNRLKLHLIEVPHHEFERLLTIREAIDDREENVPINTPSVTTTAEAATEPEVKKPNLIEPTVSGQIITGEVEKAGVAGLLQKATGLFGGTPTASEGSVKTEVNNELAPKPVDNQKNSVQEPSGQEPNSQEPNSQDSSENENEASEKKLTVPNTPTIKSIGISQQTDENSSVVTGEVDKIFQRPVTDVKQLQIIVRQGSIPRILAGLINYAVEQRASDIHIEPYGDELLIRYRVDGQLGEIMKLPMDIHPAMISRVKILAKLKLDEQRIPQDGRFDVTAAGSKAIDIRVSTLPTVHGEKVVMRLLNKSEHIYSLEKLGLSGDGLNRLLTAIKQPYGVILATGPTGSGKTTTLYAILQRVATTKVNVITLEDPVEYEMKGINQSQIKPKVGFTFAEGLRSVLRQDPNVIMVGEVRDSETAGMVTHAALTGHLVLSTLHTNNAAGALPRLINMGVEPFLITSAMNAIVGQRLVRRLCPKCREKVELPATVRKEIDEELEAIRKYNPKEASRIPANIEFFRPLEGCADCASGYRGRVGLYEVFNMDEAIAELAIKKAPAVDIEHQAKEAGMITMKQDGILKVLEGLTTLDEVLRETSNR